MISGLEWFPTEGSVGHDEGYDPQRFSNMTDAKRYIIESVEGTGEASATDDFDFDAIVNALVEYQDGMYLVDSANFWAVVQDNALPSK